MAVFRERERERINYICPCILAHQNQLRAVPDEKNEVVCLDFLHTCLCIFANQIRTIHVKIV